MSIFCQLLFGNCTGFTLMLNTLRQHIHNVVVSHRPPTLLRNRRRRRRGLSVHRRTFRYTSGIRIFPLLHRRNLINLISIRLTVHRRNRRSTAYFEIHRSVPSLFRLWLNRDLAGIAGISLAGELRAKTGALGPRRQRRRQ